MKRLFAMLSLAACAAALIAGPAPANVMNRAELQPVPPPKIAPPPLEPLPDIYFNTGGAWLTAPTLNGSASGYSYYILHVFQCDEPIIRHMIVSFGFPTNTWSSDPIELPVEWVVAYGAPDIHSIGNPYTHSWTYRGTFLPTGAPDTSPPTEYTVVEVPWEDFITIQSGMSMIWGYENAGLCGMTWYSGVETIGWYHGNWESDAAYGRTALMQFRAVPVCVPVAERSLSAIKALY